MYTMSEYDRLISEFKVKQKLRKTKLLKVWGFLVLLVIGLIVFFVFLFPNQFESGGTSWILPVYGGIAFAVTMTGYLISLGYLSEKPYFEFLFNDIYQKLNMDQGLFLQYKAYDKEDKSFNKRGGLFTRIATVSTKRHISGQTSDSNHFDIYDTTLTTSSGNSQQTHFNGVYYVLQKQVNTTLQIRSNGSPKLKGVKFDRLKEFEDIKVYKEQEKQLSNMDHVFINFTRKLEENENHKRVYVGVHENEIHVGIWFKKHPARKDKNLSIERLNEYYKYFMSEFEFITRILELDNY